MPEITHHCQRTPFLLVGTQVDLRDSAATIEKLAKNRQKPISYEMGEKLARELKAVKYVECSALTQVRSFDVIGSQSDIPALLKKTLSMLFSFCRVNSLFEMFTVGVAELDEGYCVTDGIERVTSFVYLEMNLMRQVCVRAGGSLGCKESCARLVRERR